MAVEISPNDILSYVSKYKSEEFFDYFLSEYLDTLDINHKDKKGNTALHHALEWFAWNESKYQDFAKSLLSKGARLGVKNNKGETPFDLLLLYARKYSITKGVERLNYVSVLLSDCKIDELKELKCEGGTLALSELVKLAVECRHEGIFNLLVKNNVQISNLSDKDDNTALHYALGKLFNDHYEYESFARFLLSKDARLDIKNNKGETPFDLLVNYVDRYFEWYDVCGPFNRKTMQSLDLVVRLLSNCTDKGILKGLNGTPALNKLVKIVVDCDHKEALDLLVENNIRISSTTLEKIVTCDFNKKIFGCFLHKNKIDYQDERGDTLLHHALRHLHCYDSSFCTALPNTLRHLNCYDPGLSKVVELLSSKGARFDVKNDKGETPFDLLIKYVEEQFYGHAQRLSYAWKLLNKCENQDVRELKYKDGTPALNKLKELHIKCRNTSIIVASTLAVIGVALGVVIAVHLEMLAVGIAVGACCLVVAGIVYRLNRPVSSFEGNNIQELSNNALVPYKLTKDIADDITYSVLKPSDKLDKPNLEVTNQQVGEKI